jgi:nucleotide-binding universal stress UspA family protein
MARLAEALGRVAPQRAGPARSAVEPRSRWSARTVVVGYDGSEGARRAAARAREVVAPGGRIVLVTASPPREEGALEDGPAPPGGELEPDEEQRTVAAEPAEALAEVARDTDASLIVVGARGGSFVARTLRGSVPERLVARAPCDVLVVR